MSFSLACLVTGQRSEDFVQAEYTAGKIFAIFSSVTPSAITEFASPGADHKNELDEIGSMIAAPPHAASPS